MNVAIYSDETSHWLTQASQGIRPFDSMHKNGTLILSVVRRHPCRTIDANIHDRGEVHWRVVEGMRPLTITLTARVGQKCAMFDPDHHDVTNGVVKKKVVIRRVHPGRKYFLDTDSTCPFTVVTTGEEQIVTTAKGCDTDLVSRFYAQNSGGISATSIRQGRRPDVLVITALKDECDAFMRILKMRECVWIKGTGPTALPYHQTVIPDDGGQERLIVVACAFGMGETLAAGAAERLIAHLGKPQVLAMTGICAGHPDNTRLGDVVVATRLWKFDEGKREVVADPASGELKTTVFRDVQTFSLLPHVKLALEDYSSKWHCVVATPRPKSYEHQLRYLLWTLYDASQSGRSLDHYPDVQQECPARAKIIELASQAGLIRLEPRFELTKQGRLRVESEQAKYAAQRPQDAPAPSVRIGTMGTNAMVQKDAGLFDGLQPTIRTTLGIDMEAAAVGNVAHQHSIPFLVAKSVVDYADMHKNDNFRTYSAETSAHFLMSFLLNQATELKLWDAVA